MCDVRKTCCPVCLDPSRPGVSLYAHDASLGFCTPVYSTRLLPCLLCGGIRTSRRGVRQVPSGPHPRPLPLVGVALSLGSPPSPPRRRCLVIRHPAPLRSLMWVATAGHALHACRTTALSAAAAEVGHLQVHAYRHDDLQPHTLTVRNNVDGMDCAAICVCSRGGGGGGSNHTFISVRVPRRCGHVTAPTALSQTP